MWGRDPPLLTPSIRLAQVEYAIEAISHAGSAVGILSTEGVVLAAEKKILSKARGACPLPAPLARRARRGCGRTARARACRERCGPPAPPPARRGPTLP